MLVVSCFELDQSMKVCIVVPSDIMIKKLAKKASEFCFFSRYKNKVGSTMKQRKICMLILFGQQTAKRCYIDTKAMFVCKK